MRRAGGRGECDSVAAPAVTTHRGDHVSAAGAAGAPPARLLLPRLSGVRSVAALAIFGYHLDEWGVVALPERLSQVAYAVVAFFFVLSGFVLACYVRPDLPALTFYRRRFARIWPAHLVALVAAALVPLVALSRSWEVAVPNALLLQAWLPPRFAYGMNGVTWSLSCEAFFYLVFPLAIRAAVRASHRLVAAVVTAALAAEAVAGLVAPAWAFHWPLFRLPEFLLGVALGLAFRRGWRPRVSATGAVVALVVVGAASAWLPRPLADVTTGVTSAVVLLAAARRDVEGRAGLLRHRAVVLAGEASFSFFLVHELVILNVAPHLRTGSAVTVAVLLVLGCAAALVLHVGVERPLNRRLRGGGRSVALAPPSRVVG